jgi:Zn-dependent peptidase ImmA (M78 family)
VSPRRAYPRRNESHEGAAADVLDRHRQMAGWAPSLPIPVELIIDATFDVRISWDDIAERPGEWILGALHPKSRSIVLNDRHEDLLIDVVGPLNFTLAHELGHWLYDADDPNQEQLFDPDQPVFCRRLQGDDPGQIREINANKFASALLIPAHHVRAAVSGPLPSVSAFNSLAQSWGVSRRALRIRFETLELDSYLPGGLV